MLTDPRVVKSSREATAIGAATVGSGAAITAGVASACCVGPALAPVFVTVLGAGGLATVSGLRPYTPWMLAVSGAMLAFSFYQLYRRRTRCGPAGAGPTLGIRVARGVTWLASVLWLVSSGYSIYGFLHE